MLLIKMLFIKKAFNAVFWFSKNKEMILPHEFIFVFFRYFIGAMLTEKPCQKWGVRKNNKKGDGNIGGLSIEEGTQTFCAL